MKLSSRVNDSEPEINLTSLIDVIFVLIIFFVATTTFNQRSTLKLQLPTAQASAKQDPGEPLTVLVNAEGRYFIGENEVLKSDVGSLKEAILAVAGQDRSMPVVLRADARTPHQFVITAMDALGQLGFVKLSIATTPEKNKTQ
ncbi:MAG: biopolymer transporter ExbD [Arenimonas sp.]